MFNPWACTNSRGGGVAELEIVDASECRKHGPRRFVPLRRTQLTGKVIGPLATLRLTHTYGYSRKECDRVLEAIYRFPLPGDAAVTSVRVRFGDVEIRSELKPRAEAERLYAEARERGEQAALTVRESPDVFTLYVAGIQPDQEITVQTDYVQLARAEGSGWCLRVPLTVAPRYVRGDELSSPHAKGQPLSLLRDPGHRFSLDLELIGIKEVKSSTHRLGVAGDGPHKRVRLQDTEVIPDRDFVLCWLPNQNPERPALRVWLHDDPASDQVYFLASVTPPSTRHSDRAVPREVILLVDHSGSMSGAKWEAADWTVKKFLTGLTENDAFNLGVFHTFATWFSTAPSQAGAEEIRNATRFLEIQRDSGGTELGVALEQALHQKRSPGGRARHLVIITDAEVTDAGRILRLADQEYGREDRRRISVLCIDSSPNAFLATELAERGGGVARFLTSDPAEEDISTALDEVLADWERPALAGLRLEVNRPAVQAAGRNTIKSRGLQGSAIDLGDLPPGRSIWVAGRVAREAGDGLEFVLTAAGEGEQARCSLDLAGHPHDMPAVKALFGARRIAEIEHLTNAGYDLEEVVARLQRMGYDPGELLGGLSGKTAKIYPENIGRDAREALRELLVRESLSFGLASWATGFVAVRREAGKQVEGTFVVANALPGEWSDDFLASGLKRGGYMAQSLISFSAAIPQTVSDQTFYSSSIVHHAARESDLARSVVFSGLPVFSDGEAVLFDSARDADAVRLPGNQVTFSRLVVDFPGFAPDPPNLDSGLSLTLYVGDLSSPRARVRLADLVRQGGERPLNLLWFAGQRMLLVLHDFNGAWAGGAPRIEIRLEWYGH